MAVKQVQRYIRLNELVPDLMKLMDEKMGEAILARDSADLAWVSNLSSATYEILWGVFDRHICLLYTSRCV